MIHLLLFILAVLLICDWLQTLTIAAHPERWRERNPILGPHPSIAKVHTWFALCGALAVGLTLLPEMAAVVAMTAWIACEAVCIVHNHSVGLDG